MEFCMRVASQEILDEITKHPNENLVMSPLSLNCLLNLTAAGAKGSTLDQLLEFLQSDSVADLNNHSSKLIDLATKDGEKQGPVVVLANGVWVDQRCPLKPSFKAIAKDVYKAQTKDVDFALQGEEARKEINSWVEKQTRGLIKGLDRPFTESTVLVLGNALYFKGEWLRPFYDYNTRTEDFHLLNEEAPPIKVPFLTNFGGDHFYSYFEGVQTLKLPYKNGQDNTQFSMYILLPNKKVGLQKLVEKVNSDSRVLDKLLNLQEVDLSKVWIPKFKFSYGFAASDAVQKLGLTKPFEPIKELTEMVDSDISDKLAVSSIFLKSFIEVDELGTEAAAYGEESDDDMGFSLADWKEPPPRPSFVADHPFMFMIKEEVSGTVFFIGSVLNPLQEGS